MSVEVIKPGALSTFQDLGRTGYQRFGVQVNGAMDERSHRLANMVVGNSAAEATLEVTLLGPTLLFHTAATIAVSGADLVPTLNGMAIPMNQSVDVSDGDVLAFGNRKDGLRAYLAVHGGYDLPVIMGSLSTNVRAGFGGAGGLPLRKGNSIGLRVSGAWSQNIDRILPDFPSSVLGEPASPVRTVAGREWDFFSDVAQHNFIEQPYRIGTKSDRMGYRLAGAALPLAAPREILSETVGFGTIQVPTDGQPIVLMADRPTSGGYPKIAHVISVDLPRLAQMMPGESVHFELIDLAEAQKLALIQASIFSQMEARHG